MAHHKITPNEKRGHISINQKYFLYEEISAQIDDIDSSLINIVSGGDYEYYKVPYTIFLDADNNSFPTANDVVTYINTNSEKEFNGGLSYEDKSVLDRLTYNIETDKLEADSPITTTLNSFYLGEQHKISSGAENIFFTNLVSDVDWFPMWGGIKDQSVIENQDSSGTISPSGRVYGNFVDVDFYGSLGNTAIDYTSEIRNLDTNLSVFGIEFAPELIPIIGDY